MKRKLATAIGIGILALVAGYAISFVPRATSVRAVSKPVPDIDQIQQLAEEACLCEQRRGTECDKEYNAAVAGHVSEGAATACAPISANYDDVTFGGKTYSVARGFDVVAKLPAGMSHRLCRRADAQAVEAAYMKAFGPPPDWSKEDETSMKARSDAANRAMTEAILEINNGKKMAPVVDSKGCA